MSIASTSKRNDVSSSGSDSAFLNALHDGDSASTSGLSVVSRQELNPQNGFNSHLDGLLFCERFESFTRNDWPYTEDEDDFCNPRELALAGLQYHKEDGLTEPGAQCVICNIQLNNLRANSNPWKLHSKMNTKCPLIKLGKREEPEEYTVAEYVGLIGERQAMNIENGYKQLELEVKTKLVQLFESKQS